MPGGRPKTGTGHRDDALLAISDFIGLIGELRTMEQQHYRKKRALIDDMQAKVIESSQSWRYGELVDEMMGQRAVAS